ncbi:MAG: transcriptional regulator [Caulobacterales bacterium]|nr:transcriptional regulator [Caulobacterales bacterium]
MTHPYRFGDFELDVANRRLSRDGQAVELSARYFDALALMVSEPGHLITKDRFLDEVWRGVPVTDEALTQCVRSLRRALGDEAGRPRFIETVPKHGYRFVAPVENGHRHPAAVADGSVPTPVSGLAQAWRLALAGTAGGAVAGAVGGVIYGFLAAGDPLQPGLGSGSIVIVLTCVTILVAATGAAGVSVGVAGADLLAKRPGPWRIVGGALGGMIVGAVVKVLGLDAFSLLLGQAPAAITGGGGGLVLGAAVGVGAWLASRSGVSLRRAVSSAGLIGAVAGVAFSLMGGHLFGGSLDQLAQQFEPSRLSLDGVGRLFGEDGFGWTARAVTSALEGLLFGACLTGAMGLAGRRS